MDIRISEGAGYLAVHATGDLSLRTVPALRDSLLKAAEKRIEQRLQELKELEARVNGTISKKDEEEAAKFKTLVGEP